MEWEEIVRQMSVLFDKLQQTPLVDRASIQQSFHFKSGIYVLYEKGGPLYVGRTKRYIAKRVLIHGRACSKHNAASFAFLLAKEQARREGMNIDRTRDLLQQDKRFKTIFAEQKERIRKMQMRAIQISDPEVQAIFEIYASKRLGTKYNDFNTH